MCMLCADAVDSASCRMSQPQATLEAHHLTAFRDGSAASCIVTLYSCKRVYRVEVVMDERGKAGHATGTAVSSVAAA